MDGLGALLMNTPALDYTAQDERDTRLEAMLSKFVGRYEHCKTPGQALDLPDSVDADDEPLSARAEKTLLDYFVQRGGVPDVWAAWLRRVCKQSAMLMFVWTAATVAGLHDPRAGITADLAATYAVRLGYAAEADHRKLSRAFQEALEKLTTFQILTKEINTISFGQNLDEGQPTPLKSPPKGDIGANRSQAHSCAAFKCVPARETRERLYECFIKSRLEESLFPGLSSTAPAADQVVRVDLRAEHFMGEYSASPEDAQAIANDIADNLTLQPADKPTADLEHKRAKTLPKALTSIQIALGTDRTVTPLPEGAQFSNCSDFDAARYRGAVENRPDSSTWAQWQWTDFLGVSKGTLINLRKDAGLRTKQRTVSIALKPGDVHHQVRDAAHKAKGIPVKMDVYDPQTKTRESVPYSVQAAEEYRARECAVNVIVQQSSITEIDPAGPQPRKPTVSKPVETPQPRLFKPYDGPGFSNAWLHSQVVLNLVRAGHPQSVISLSLDDAIALARGKEKPLFATLSHPEVEDRVIAPEPQEPDSLGSQLFKIQQSLRKTDPNKADDWWLDLPADERMALIEYRAELRRQRTAA